MLHGKVKHEDSMGNGGVIESGDVQWMTAGSGIIHSEMPHQEDGLLWGFQLWANLPASQKMMDPRYRDIQNAQIPEVSLKNGIKARVICGELAGTRGPTQDIVIDPEYLDVTHTMYFLKSTIWLLSDFGVRWYAYSEPSSNQWLMVLDLWKSSSKGRSPALPANCSIFKEELS
jgi:hypothetical protein